MGNKPKKSSEQLADTLVSLLALGESKHRAAPDQEKALREETVSSLRQLNDDALLDTLHIFYRTAARHSQNHRGSKPLERINPAAESAAIPGTLSVALWLVTATVAGSVVMSLELAAFRLYAPYFGYSIYVWGSMISVVMVALSLGYFFGGRLADRSRGDRSLYLLVLGSALYQLLILFTVHPLLQGLSRRGEFLGTVVATLIVFTPSMTALAAVGPYVIRLLTQSGRAGATAGRVYALSTLGSVAGILITSFYLVPRFGTNVTLTVACATSALLAAAGLMRMKRAALVAVALLGALPFVPPAAWSANTLWASESAYNLVRVVGPRDNLKLILNDGRSVATRRNEITGWTGGYYDDFSLGPLLVPAARRVLVLGMGAGGSIAATQAAAPELEFDAVEIDPTVVEAAVRFFELRTDDPRIRVHVADARPWIARDDGRYDIVHVDLYQGGPYIPFYLVTREFFELVRARMADDGLLMMNVLDLGEHRELLRATAATLRQVFPSVMVLSRPNGNHMVLAFPRERSASWVRQTLANVVEGQEQVRTNAHAAASVIQDLVPGDGATVFTDDHAPVEDMTRRMLARTRT